MKIIVMAFLLFSLIACNKPTELPAEQTVDEALMESAKVEVANTLKDPLSAQFRNIKVVGGVVCGEINAKNAMGGYVGFKYFEYNKYLGNYSSISDTLPSSCK